MNITQEKRLVGLPGSGQIYISGEVILYSIRDISQKTGVAYGSISRMFDAPGFASIDFGRQKLVENHALMKFFSVRRDKETRIYRFKLDRDPWGDDIYDKYYSYFTEDYRRRRKEIDEMQLDWLDAIAMYASPEVVFYTEEDILKHSNWSEEEVERLFADTRFPRTEMGSRKIVEVHALIQFFARKELIMHKQLAEHERREEMFAHLRRKRSGR